MRLRQSASTLKRLQLALKNRGHGPDDPHARAILSNFWDKLRIDKRIARGEL